MSHVPKPYLPNLSLHRYGKLQPGSRNYRMTDAEYKAEHSLVLQGEQPLPEAFQTFESVGFPQDIMDEVRFSAQGAGRGGPWCLGASGGCASLWEFERFYRNSQCRVHTATPTAAAATAAPSPPTCMAPGNSGAPLWCCPLSQRQLLQQRSACAAA